MRNATRAEGRLVLDDTTSVSDMFNPARVYAKGGAVLHMLRAIVGEEDFRTILRTYTADPAVAHGTATTADFKRVAEGVYGASLDTFFSQWVTDGTGYPRYRVSARLQRHGDYRVYLTVEQTQDGTESNVGVFEMPITVAVQTEGGEERFTVVNNQRRQDYVIDVVGKPTAVVFDPDLSLLRDQDLEPSGSTMAAVPAFESIAPNPFGSTGDIFITLPDDNPATLRLFDVAGRFVRDVATVGGAGPHRVTIDSDGLPSGVYFLRMDAASGGVVRKITIVR
jgi:hypothetical protein